MPIIYTVIAGVSDWWTMQNLNRGAIQAKPWALNARRCQIYRNLNDASQALLWFELLNPDDVCEMREALAEQLNSSIDVRLLDDRVWVPVKPLAR